MCKNVQENVNNNANVARYWMPLSDSERIEKKRDNHLHAKSDVNWQSVAAPGIG